MNTALVGSFFGAARTSGVGRRLGRSEGLGCLAKRGAIGHSRSSREWESRCKGKEGEACVDATRRRTSWRSGGAQGRSWCSFSSLQLVLSLQHYHLLRPTRVNHNVSATVLSVFFLFHQSASTALSVEVIRDFQISGTAMNRAPSVQPTIPRSNKPTRTYCKASTPCSLRIGDRRSAPSRARVNAASS